ncbi:MAG: hypothetical protein RL641_276 [Candidatus Parcubacteria bacterium]|jgi:hypothetical protein
MDWKKYLIVFIITLGVFATALYISNSLNSKKFTELKSIEDKLSVDILSSEVQFSLLEELSCKDVTTSVLSDELSTLADKISFSESNFAEGSDQISQLKQSYSLLEIKDYLLMKKISERCGIKSVFVLYFYANKDTCLDCVKQGYILTELRNSYPELRVYSFDYNLDLSAVKALISIYKVPDKLPALLINGKVYSGLQTKEEIETVLKLNLGDKATSKKIIAPQIKTE